MTTVASILSHLPDAAGDYAKIALYSTGIGCAFIGYLSAKKRYRSKASVLSTVYCPLLLQYPASFDLFYGLIKLRTKSVPVTQALSLVSVSFITSLVIPWMHYKIHFAEPETFETRQVLSLLFRPSSKALMGHTFHAIFAMLGLSQINSYRTGRSSDLTWENTLYLRLGLYFGSNLFDTFVVKNLKAWLEINKNTPPLTLREVGDAFINNQTHNYARYVLFDSAQSSLPPGVASICLEYAVGVGFMDSKDAHIALATALYNCYANKTRAQIETLRPNEDTRFVKKVEKILSKLRSGLGRGVTPGFSDQRELSTLWIRNEMSPLYSSKAMYSFLLACTCTDTNILKL